MPVIATALSRIRLPSGAPVDGNSVVPINLTLAGGEKFTVQSDILSRVSSIWIDATKCLTGFEVVFQDTGRRIVVPAGVELCTRTFSNDGQFTVLNLDPSIVATFRAILFACPQPVFERYPGAGSLPINALVLGEFAQPAGSKVLTAVYVAPTVPVAGAWSSAMAAANPNVVLSNGGYTATFATNSLTSIRVPFPRASGKYYIEIQNYSSSNNAHRVGFANISQGDGTNIPASGAFEVMFDQFGYLYLGNTNTTVYVNAGGHGCFAIDLNAKLIWARGTSLPWNNVSSADPVAGIGGIDISMVQMPVAPSARSAQVTSLIQSVDLIDTPIALKYPVPAGYIAGWPGI